MQASPRTAPSPSPNNEMGLFVYSSCRPQRMSPVALFLAMQVAVPDVQRHVVRHEGTGTNLSPRPADSASGSWPWPTPFRHALKRRTMVTSGISYSARSGDGPAAECQNCSSCRCFDWYHSQPTAFPAFVETNQNGSLANAALRAAASPPKARSRSVVIFFHGGLWFSGSRDEISDVCTSLADDHAVDCIAADYKYSQDLGGCCSSPQRCRETYSKQAREFVQAIAKTVEVTGLGYEHVFVGGHSAGGHLALLLALSWHNISGGPAPAGFFGVEGIYNASLWGRYDATHWQGHYACQTRQSFGDNPDSLTWKTGSPTFLAADNAPAASTLLIHSPADDWVQSTQTTALHAALKVPENAGQNSIDVDGVCVSGQHPDVLNGKSARALARCLVKMLIMNEG